MEKQIMKCKKIQDKIIKKLAKIRKLEEEIYFLAKKRDKIRMKNKK